MRVLSNRKLKFLKGQCVVEEIKVPELTFWKEDAIDVIVVDLERKNAAEILRVLREEKLEFPLVGLSRPKYGESFPAQETRFMEYENASYLLQKPFSSEDLFVRIKRAAGNREGVHGACTRELAGGDVLLEENKRRLSVKGKKVHLTRREWQIFCCLAASPGRVCSKEHIMANLYTIDDEPQIKIVDAFVCRIRKKLDEVCKGSGKLLKTVWGCGYRIDPEWRIPSAEAIARRDRQVNGVEHEVQC